MDTDSDGLKAQNMTAQGKVSPRTPPWVNRPTKYSQALKERHIQTTKQPGHKAENRVNEEGASGSPSFDKMD